MRCDARPSPYLSDEDFLLNIDHQPDFFTPVSLGVGARYATGWMSEGCPADPERSGGPAGCCGGTPGPGALAGAPGAPGTGGSVMPGGSGIPDRSGWRAPLAMP